MRWWPSRTGRHSSGLPGSPRHTTGQRIQACGRNRFPLLARLAPETGEMRLMTLVILLPLLNPVETAENVATLDAISHGRLTLGVAIGYREAELEAVGLTRKDRVPKLEESLALMKQLWSWRRGDLRRPVCPCHQTAHGLDAGAKAPSAYRHGVSERARHRAGGAPHRRGVLRATGRLGGHRQAHRHLPAGARRSRTFLVRACSGPRGRCCWGKTRQDAARIGRAYLERTFANYRAWEMQESTMVPLALSFDRPLQDWTVHGSTADCVETLLRAREEMGLTHISFTMYNLPRELPARLEYLERVRGGNPPESGVNATMIRHLAMLVTAVNVC